MSVLTDQPITNATGDRFGRKEFATRIANVLSLLEDKSSIVIGVNAPWGEGKTSVLNMIEDELRKGDKTFVVRFNPWRFPDEERLLSNFFTTLADRIGTDPKTFPEKIGESIKDLAKGLSVFQFAGINAAGAKEMAESIFPKTDIEEIKERISRALADSPKRIVVFMDDIDRLDKKDIQAVFRLVKLTADFPNTAYVLAFDDEKVASALADQYGSYEAGRGFIEKIVQVPLPVPPASPQALRKMVFEGINSALNLAEVELTQDEADRCAPIFDRSFGRKLSSPRVVKRYINMLNFALPILKGEVNVLDLILIEGVRAFYPKLYGVIRSEPNVFLKDSIEVLMSFNKEQWKDRFQEISKGLVEGLTTHEARDMYFVLQVLFPRIREYGITRADYYSRNDGEDLGKKKSIATSSYFYRYFNYGVPPDDVSDKEIKALLASLARAEIDQIMKDIDTLSSDNRAEVMIQKLRMHEDEIPSESAVKLALAIARRGELLPEGDPHSNIIGFGVLAQAAFHLRRLIERIEDAETREETAKAVETNIEQLPFAYEFVRKIRKLRKEHGSEEFIAVVSDQCEGEIGRIFAQKLAKMAESAPIEDMHPKMKRPFYSEWRWAAPESLQQYIRRRLQEHPEDVGKFLNAVLGLSNQEGSNHVSIDNADVEYQIITGIIDPTEVMEAIERAFSKNLNSALPRIIEWFHHMHRQAAMAKAAASEETG